MAYFRTKQGGDVAVSLPLPTSGGAALGIPNYGITQITATSADIYALNPPVAGVQKTLVIHQYSTTVFPVVRLSTSNTVTILGGSTNLCMIKSAAGKSTIVPTVINMVGLNSTQWLITSVWPNMGSVTTGSTAVNTGISLSST